MTLRLFSFVCLLTSVLVSTPTGQGRAQSPPSQDPILRVDPGMHTARIARIGVNPTCSFVASASDDKTVRLWRLPDGEPLKTLRPPIGPGYDGRVNAIAVAPDLTWVAAGVDALDTALKGDVVYIFQPVSGTILARLGPLQGSVTHLAVSPDGRYLAATLGGGHGLRIWQIVGANASSWRLIADDSSYGGKASYGAAFDRTGVLFTVADDGKLRRYAPGYDSVPKWALPQGGRVPRSVAAHPAGDRVAIGYEDTPSVDVYDSVSLGFRFAADTKFAVNGNLLAVAWSGDGNRLYAGGTFARVVGGVDKGSPIFVWDRAGQGAPQELPGPPNTVQHLLTCSDDIAVGASGPTLGLLAPDGSRRLWKESAQADLRGRRGQDVSVTQNGLRVRFGLNREHDPVLFDIAAEQLTDAPNRASDLVDADTTGLPVTDWFDSWQPKLSGIPIKLMQNEQSHALAVAPDAQRFVLGGDWSLRGFSRDGKQIWQKAVPTVWNLNVTRDGKLVVSAYGDGTVRWHRLSDGEELLALFVHKTDRRWVAWTPKGYYMASPGAESLIGWHVNRGWNEAPQFYSVDRFRDQFNRPDIVKSVLAALDESKAIDEANRRANLTRPEENVRAIAPPVILIQKPSDNASFRAPEVTLEYQAFSPTGQRITDVDVRINNSSLGSRAAVPLNARSGDSIKLTLTLPPEDVTITLVAREGTKASQPASIRLRWDGAKPGQVQLPRLRALFVGVNAYSAPDLPKLQFAAKDASDLSAFFKAQEGKTYHKVESKLLPDAKRADVLEGLEWLERGSEETDVNLLFLAGHGITDEQQQFYYMAADSEPERARATGVSRNEILQTIRNRRGAMVVMLDACHSGDTAGTGSRQSRVDMNKLVNEFGDKSLGVFLYASALGRQFSYEHPDWRNGAFTRAMIEGLSGAADRDKLGFVETDELAVYVRRRVMNMTKDMQEPVRMKPDATPEIRLVLIK